MLTPIHVHGERINEVEHNLVIPANYGCLALLDSESYEGFVHEDWQLNQLKRHICSQAAKERIVAWGCVSGNWRIRFTIGQNPIAAVHEFSGVIRSSGNLLLTSYESLTMAAQFEDVKLPEPHEVSNLLEVPRGRFIVHVGQTFDHSQAEAEEVFEQASPHFIVSLLPGQQTISTPATIPWFPDGG